MTVIDCPVCEAKVNASAAHCPGCGADPRLSPEDARAGLLARGLSLPASGQEGQARAASRIWWWSALAVFFWAVVYESLYHTHAHVSYAALLIVACVGLALLVAVALAVLFSKRGWSLRRRLGLLALVVLVTAVLLAPTWAGYFGRRAAAYGVEWRPWRTPFKVQLYEQHGRRMADMEVSYPARGDESSGDYLVVVECPRPWLPWLVTEQDYGVPSGI